MMSRIDELAAFHDTHSAADEINAAIDAGAAQWETETSPNPMIGITVRLPKQVLDAVRGLAAAQHVKPTALIRSWVETAVADDEAVSPATMAALAQVVRESVHAELVNAKLAA